MSKRLVDHTNEELLAELARRNQSVPGHTTLWSPDHFIIALRHMARNFGEAGSTLMQNEAEGAARMMWKLWQAADPEAAEKAKPKLFNSPDRGIETASEK